MGKMYFWDQGEIALLITLVEYADYWQQLVFPVTARMYQRLPLLADVAADQYTFFGEMQVTSISAEPAVTMDISSYPLVEMSIRTVKLRT